MIFRVVMSGTALALLIPKEACKRLRLEKGDGVYAYEIPGGYAIKTFSEEFAREMDLSEEAIWRDRELLAAIERLDLP